MLKQMPTSCRRMEEAANPPFRPFSASVLFDNSTLTNKEIVLKTVLNAIHSFIAFVLCGETIHNNTLGGILPSSSFARGAFTHNPGSSR